MSRWNLTYQFIGGPGFSTAEHVQVAEEEETSQILYSHRQHPQRRIPKTIYKIQKPIKKLNYDKIDSHDHTHRKDAARSQFRSLNK